MITPVPIRSLDNKSTWNMHGILQMLDDNNMKPAELANDIDDILYFMSQGIDEDIIQERAKEYKDSCYTLHSLKRAIESMEKL